MKLLASALLSVTALSVVTISYVQAADAPAPSSPPGLTELKLPEPIQIPVLPATTPNTVNNTDSKITAAPLAPALPSPATLPLPNAASAIQPVTVPEPPKIDALPQPPMSPPIPALPQLPGMAPSPQPEIAPSEVKKEENVTAPALVEKPKSTKKYKRHKKKTSSVIHAKNRNPFRYERLPATIYKKSYDKLNRHLPTAYYEKDYDGLLFVTAEHDDLNGLRSVLDAGRNMELMDHDGDTPLLVAVKHNAVNAARLLLARHANSRVVDASGMTPLQIAEQNGNNEIAYAIVAASGRAQ